MDLGNIIIFLVFLGVLSRVNGETHIVGGSDGRIEDYPYQISLQLRGSHICGGSIYGTRKVITAAHCTFGEQASSFTIRASSSIRESGGQVVQVSSIKQHPRYDPVTTDNDISILILSSPITFGPGAAAIYLPLMDPNLAIFQGRMCSISGWGTLSSGGASPTQLQAATVPITSHIDCKQAYSSRGVVITDNMVCAGYNQGGIDTCQGDSGGPLVYKDKLTGLNILYGVVSFGIGCADPGFAGVYTNVFNYMGFIGLPTVFD